MSDWVDLRYGYVVRETEKAALLEVRATIKRPGRRPDHGELLEIWIPKKLLRTGGRGCYRLPRSIVEQKETEAAEELGAECVGISVFEEE
jgi:hypothetical protein